MNLRIILISILSTALTCAFIFINSPAYAATGCVWTTNVADHSSGKRECSSWTSVRRLSSDTPSSKVQLRCLSGHRALLWGKQVYYCASGQRAFTTTQRPYLVGASGSTARSIESAAVRLASSHSVRLQWAKRDERGWMACSTKPSLVGTYSPGPPYARGGEGLIRMSHGNSPSCVTRAGRTRTLNLTRHELAHAIIGRRCGTTRPPIVGSHAENVADAYADKYVGATVRNSGGYGYGPWAASVATKIRNGKCR